ncbi:MAG: DUF3014 domain-containing protein [Burkholderiaceae bacterium]|nr:DUF3014 domain-containing protein [Burkholderiaceae bacterium]
MPPPNAPPATTAGPPWWLVLVAILAIVTGLYLWLRDGPKPVPPGPGVPPASSSVGSAAPDGAPQAGNAPAGAASEADASAPKVDAPKYPLPAAQAEASALPETEHSDPPVLEALLGLATRDAMAQFLNMQDFVRRFVVTVDHLPRELIPAQLSAVRRVPGALAVATEDGTITLQPENFTRYDAFVRFVESLDSRKMVAVYLRFYPLLQREYRAMGFPQGHFHDRVIEAIDDMLAAPEVTGPIRLVQPQVHHKFADPLLESLSAGRKIMIRVGPAHAARLKKVLRELRAGLVR